ncbi:MAG: HD domain-containing phosphohydrolase [Tepidisphaeraceae bacterium]|jgi:putative two-component system response regulator
MDNNSGMLFGRVLIVGSEQGLAEIGGVVQDLPWTCILSHSVREALRLLREDPALDMVVLAPGDAVDPYLELCRTIKFDKRTSFLSVVAILGPQHAHRGEHAFDAGADDLACTSAPRRETVQRLLRALRVKRATDQLEDSAAVLTALANAIEGKDHCTCGHVERVGAYCVEIGRRLGVCDDELAALKTGGVVHDIGKIGIPDQILNKPGKLTDEEFAIVKRHPLIGYDILKSLRTFRLVLPIVRWHHERPNGTGYPDGLQGADLPLLPRITSVADVFDAISTDRPYRKALPLAQCRTILTGDAEKGWLDMDIVKIFCEILDSGSQNLLQAAA